VSKRKPSKWEMEPDEPSIFPEPYAVNLPEGVVCHELSGQESEISEFIEDFNRCGLISSHSSTNEYGFPYRKMKR
jgi:hypothetical protein